MRSQPAASCRCDSPSYMLKTKLLIFILFAFTVNASAQVNGVFVDNLKTLRVEVDGQWDAPPVMPMGHHVRISFDDLQHSYVRYTYHITHCNSDWTPSDLLESDYIDGFNDRPIDDYNPSMNTTVEYNHYTFTLPNKDVKLLLSGNYTVDIYEDGDDEPVARACFSVLENKIGLNLSVSPNTDIDQYSIHQQLDFSINYQSYSVHRPEEEFHPVVLKNRRWDTRVEGLTPTYTKSNELIYSHNRALIFDAGNEYRRFEILDEYVPTMNVESMSYHEPYYHATLMTDEPRRNYIYDQDQNGRVYIRNGDNVDNDTESDYFITHFTLQMPELEGGSVYLNGDLTYNSFSETYEMEYDYERGSYQLALPLKQGSYNYQYVFVGDDNDWADGSETEGNFYQTENEYSVYVYHRPFGERYDHLVGYNMVRNGTK